MLLVLLCSWLPCAFKHDQDFEPYKLLDFFAGKGRISQLAARAGIPCASLDLCMDPGHSSKKGPRRTHKKANRRYRSSMDWNGDSGLVFFDCKKIRIILSMPSFNPSPAKAGGRALPQGLLRGSAGGYRNSVLVLGSDQRWKFVALATGSQWRPWMFGQQTGEQNVRKDTV